MNTAKKILFSVAAVSAATFLYAAEPPQIEAGRVDVLINQVRKQAELSGQTVTSEQLQQLRQDIVKGLQRTEVIKNAALAAKLNERPAVQQELKNLEAQFYTQQYVEYLKENMSVSDAQLRSLYDELGREIKLSQAVFSSREDAEAALEKLRKGLSFNDLVDSLTDQPAAPDGFMSAQGLPPEMAAEVGRMEKGKISSAPLEFQGKFYLFKIADVRMAQNLPPFTQVRPMLLEQKQNELIDQELKKLLAEHGLE